MWCECGDQVVGWGLRVSDMLSRLYVTKRQSENENRLEADFK